MWKGYCMLHPHRFPSSTLGIGVVGALMWLGAFSAVVTAQSPTISEERSGHDPLSLTEIERVRNAVLNERSTQTRRQGGQPREELMIDLHQETKAVRRRTDAPRRADVLFYDYRTESTMRAVVDVRSGKVETVETVQGMKPLISRTEAARALAITLADPQANAFIRAQYQARTDTPLRSSDDLVVTAGVFHVDVMPTVAAVEECEVHRCAQLLLTSKTDESLSAMPIVNLSTGQLLYLGQ
jgi:Cu2+-containing amine oxidase